jgi:hypothetical protein
MEIPTGRPKKEADEEGGEQERPIAEKVGEMIGKAGMKAGISKKRPTLAACM